LSILERLGIPRGLCVLVAQRTQALDLGMNVGVELGHGKSSPGRAIITLTFS
jgi:hypothetical protein